MDIEYRNLSRLRRDLGDNTTMVRGLVADFAACIGDLRASSDGTDEELADLVHKVTGTASLVVPDQTMIGLNHLEQAFRSHSKTAQQSYAAMCEHLDDLAASFQGWIESAPPDGVPFEA